MSESCATSRPRIGLVCGELTGIGGLEMSALRHVKLLSGIIDVIPISLEASKDEGDWCGRAERTELNGRTSYRIFTSDFRIDRTIGLMDFSKHSHLEHLTRIAEAERLTGLHVFGAFEMRPFIAAIAAARLDLPLIVSFRGVDLDLRIFGANFAHLTAALQVANLVVCVNSAAQRVVQRVLKVGCPVHVVHNHVEPDDFEDAQVELSLPRPVIGCVGEFRRIMGLDYLLQAFTRLYSDDGGSLLLIGPFRPMEAMYYSNLIDNLKCSPHIHRVGSIEHGHVLSYMKACDVLVFPSISDGSPNKILEAMLAARAIIASAVGGIPELIRDGTDGVLLPSRDSQRLATEIASLLKDPERRNNLGKNARERAVSTFSPARALAAWLECYQNAGVC